MRAEGIVLSVALARGGCSPLIDVILAFLCWRRCLRQGLQEDVLRAASQATPAELAEQRGDISEPSCLTAEADELPAVLIPGEPIVQDHCLDHARSAGGNWDRCNGLPACSEATCLIQQHAERSMSRHTAEARQQHRAMPS